MTSRVGQGGKSPQRLGTIYRDEMLHVLGRRAGAGRVLDVGCHDGFFLSTLSAPVRVGVDLDPPPGRAGVALVRADARALPFAEGAFDHIYALDVIEHVEDDRAFACSLARVLAPGGRLFLTTPSRFIRLNPAFLTVPISRRWGHHLRLGYTAAELTELFGPYLHVHTQTWNAPAFRFWYLALRALFAAAPRLAEPLVRWAARADARRPAGQQGYQILEAERPSSTASLKAGA